MSKQEKGSATDPHRVLFVLPEETLSGVAIQIVHLANWLKQHNWETAVALPGEGPAADLSRANVIEVLFESQLLLDLKHDAVRRLVSRFDLVVVNKIAGHFAAEAAHLENVPVVWCLHEANLDAHVIPSLGLADLLVAPSRAVAEKYQPFTARPVQVVPYGIPELKTAALPSSRPFTFVTIGSYQSRNGQDVFLEAIHDLHPDLRWRASFQMTGRTVEKSFQDALRERSESIPNVQLLEHQSHQQSVDLLNSADVLVCPWRDETTSMVLLEAMSLGKAIICTEVGGVPEWLQNDVDALLVPPENPRAMAIALARCIGDRELVRKLGDAARQTFVKHFQLDVVCERFAKIAAETIAKARTKRTTGDYAEWVELYETLGPADRMALRRQIDSLGKQPLISVLLPVYNPDLDLLRSTVESVKQQTYDQWELCIADDASSDPEVRPFLRKLAAEDNRIRLALRERSGQMAACSNSALALATGEWSALLDQDDMLSEHALAKVALEIESNPDAGLIYSDEDKIDLNGRHSDPFFKTDWNPELFHGQNYMGHLAVYRADVLRAIGGFREEFEGAQDYDLAFRLIERLQPEQIRHIPRILYQSRTVEKSDAKSDANGEAARRAIADHLRRAGLAGRVEPCPENSKSHRVIYDLPNPVPRVEIIISNGDGQFEKRVESIRSRTNYPSFEITVANGRRQLNELAKATNADIVLFLHADVEVTDGDWLREMASHAIRREVGAVGARLCSPDGTLQHSGYVLGIGEVAGSTFGTAPRGDAGFFNLACLQRNCSAVSAMCLATRAAVFQELEGFDNTNLTSNYHDIDFCLRAREHGLEIIWTPYPNLVFRNLSTGHCAEQTPSPKQRHDVDYMRKRWGEELREEPFYNPNLSLALPGFELAFPPRWFGAA
jgi:glycosyltransferase involved in cell wall biosynthesis/GT2 family glycosyltransferase